jgi:hypothetical protein
MAPERVCLRQRIRYITNILENILEILLEGTQESVLLSRGLESTLTKLGSSVDPLETGLLEGLSRGVGLEGLSEGDDSLLDTWDGALDEEEVVLDLTVSDEATQWGDGLLGSVELGSTVHLVVTRANTVDLVVSGGSVVVTVLTGSCDGPGDVGWVPGTDTGDLTETTVGLSWKLLGAPSVGDTLVTVTLGDGHDIDHLVLLEDGGNVDGLLEVLLGPVDLVGGGTTIDLDLSQMGLLLTKRGLSDLGVGEDTDDGAVLLHSLELTVDGLAVALRVLLGVLGEGLLLGLVPVLVETSLDLVGKVLGPHGGEGTKASWGLDVTNGTNNDHWRSVNNGGGLNNLTLVHLGATSVKVTDSGGHTRLVTKEGSHGHWLALVVLREGLDLTSVTGSSLSRKESKGSVSGFFVFTMRHGWS